MGILHALRWWWHMRRPFTDQAGNTWRTVWMDGQMVHRKIAEKPRRIE